MRRPVVSIPAAVGAVIALGAFLRLAYAAFPVSAVDGGTYLIDARYILEGRYFFSREDFFPILYRTPVYPLFLALIRLILGPNLAWIAAVQRLLGLLSSLILAHVARRAWGSRAAALLALAFAAGHARLAYYESYVLSESLAVFLMSAATLAVLAAGQDRGKSIVPSLTAGLWTAIAALCRPELACIAPIAAFYLGHLRRSAYFLAPVALALGGWTLRNGLLYGYWGLTPNAEITLFAGPAGGLVDREGPGVVPSVMDSNGWEHGRVNQIVFELDRFGLEYPESSRLIGRAAAAAARRRPGEYFRTGLLGAWRLLAEDVPWPPSEDVTETIPGLFSPANERDHPLSYRWLDRTGRLFSALERVCVPLLLAIGIFLSLSNPKSRREGGFLLVVLLSLLVVYGWFSPGGPRYRVILEPLLGLFAARALMGPAAWLASRIGRARGELPGLPASIRRRSVHSLLAGSAVLGIAFYLGLGAVASGRALSLSRRAAALRERGDWEGLAQTLGRARAYGPALAAVEEGLRRAPGNADLEGLRGGILFREGKVEEAAASFERALKLSPRKLDSLYDLSVACRLLGRRKEARRRLEAFLSLAPRSTPVYEEGLALKADLAASAQ